MKLTKQIKVDLSKAYQCAMEIGILNMKAPLRYINQYIAEDVNGYGTAADEKVRSRADFRKMVMDAREQSKGTAFKAKIITPYQPKFINETTVQFRDEMLVQIGAKKNKHSLHLWFSTLFSYQHQKWQMVFFHGSIPDAGSNSDDTFHLGVAEKKVKELEQVVVLRTLDLQKKNRELEIETSLEKVRAVAMGMSKPDDLLNICEVLFKELDKIGFKDVRCSHIHIFNDKKGYFDDYDYSDFTGGKISTLPYKGNVTVENFLKKIRKSNDSFAEVVIKGKALADFLSFRKKSGQIQDKRLTKASEINYYFFSIGNGNIGISNFGKISNEQLILLKRFRNVFQLAYQRYTDIEKAVAQAKEAQIEATLERIRSKAMGMKATSEIGSLIYHLYTEMTKLDARLDRCFIMIVNPDNLGITWWLAGKEGLLNENGFFIPHNQHPSYLLYLNHWKKRQKKWQYLFEGKEKKDWDRFGFSKTDLAKLPEPIKKDMVGVNKIYLSGSSDKFGCLVTGSLEPLSEFHQEIISRFATVFNQTYTRFLDLQKAEAQTREAEIELALERVRARTMSMHNSTDVGNTAIAMFDELVHLGVNKYVRCGIGILDETKFMEVWTVSSDKKKSTVLNIGKLDMTMHPMLTQVKNSWENKQPGFTYELKGKDLRNYFLVINKQKDYPVKVEMDALPERIFHNDFRFSEGVIYAFTPEPLSAEMNQIFKRFAGVFEQTYRRFLDLQKAEAQAREAEIELALERVRARTMAMQHSDELADASFLLDQQVRALGIETRGCAFNIYGENDSWEWFSSEMGTMPAYKTPRENIFLRYYKAGLKGASLFIEEFAGKACVAHYDYLCTLPVMGDALKQMIANGGSFPKKQVDHITYFKYGYLLFITLEQVPDAHDIFKRFAKVFEQTYTRFLDLQKAEASAREAQIEAALEKVRSRSLAMHSSEELGEVVSVVLEKLQELGFVMDDGSAAHINIYPEGSKDAVQWSAAPHQSAPIRSKVPYTDNMLLTDFFEAKEKGLDFFSKKYSFEEKNSWFHYAFEHSDFKHLPDTLKKALLSSESYEHWIAIGKNSTIIVNSISGKILSEEEIEILKRFARVFEQSYVRFLDLQKAEAQTKEAGIELALERVRSQAMAMQKSSDLLDIVVTMRNEFTRLGHEAHYFWHMMWLPEKYEKAMTSGDGTKIGFVMELPRHIHGNIPLLAKWEKGKKPTVVYAMNVEEALDYVHKMVSLGDFKNIDPQAPSEDDIRHIGGLTFIMARTTHGEIGFSLPGVVEHPPKEDVDILIRFAGAFDIAHRRFLDLQQSEAQSREVEIELALEKVRSRSMGMQKSEELNEAIKIVYQQLNHLKIKLDHAGFVVDYTPKADWHFWIADEQDIPSKITHPFFESVWASQFNEAKDKGADLFATHLNFEEKNKFYKELLSYVPELPEASKDFYLSCPGLAASTVLFDNVSLYIENFEGIPYTDDENKILLRFGKVFQQTYTRFLDLQKAEAQAREAQIETALEKVRSRSLAMHKSEELGEVITVVVEKLKDLGFFVGDGIALITFSKGSKDLVEWMTNPGFASAIHFNLPHFDHPVLNNLWEAKERGEVFNFTRFSAEENKSFLDHIFEHSDFKHTPQEVKEYCLAANTYATSISFQENTAIFINDYSGKSLSEHEVNILNRFAKVFEQSYTRFLDLQKAEAQAREAQIETALEKVRSRTMAMQKSDELSETAAVLFQEFKKLGNDSIYQVTIGIYNEAEKLIEFRVTSWAGGGEQISKPFMLSMDEPTLLKPAVIAWKANEKLMVADLTGEALEGWLNYRNKMTGTIVSSADTEGRRVISIAFFSKGHLSLSSPVPLPDGTLKTLERFAAVFDGTYTRFLDLKNAEAQAREARIEMALEKIRSRTMAMQHSNELPEAANLLFLEVQALGIPAWSCGYNILAEDRTTATCWMSSEGTLQIPFKLRLFGEASFAEMGDFIRSEQSMLVQELSNQALGDHYAYMKSFPDLKATFDQIDELGLSLPAYQINHLCKFTQGFLLFITYEQVPHAHDIFKRFTKVFEQTYTRFLDLKKVEAQARQSQIEAALERVRARALAMQQPEELKDVAKVLRHEMGLLGIEELETCSIYINDEQSEKAECWYALKDMRSEEKKLVNDHFALNLNDTWVGREMLSFYNSAIKQISVVMQGANRVEWIRYCEASSTPFRGYYGDVIPDRTYHLYKFSHGAIGAASAGDISIESWSLLKRAASVFSLAYSRFKDLTQARVDLQKLKEEKQRAEDALSNLQAAQKQLVQSEKMASLGELTAGIAHEIQNPLNFVNNFSEVSKELLDEMREELKKGNQEDAMEIMNDVIQNLEKINHHGKRADGIVKGMLQHSRSSSSTKESTDINALCDEYLRLSYHGLRAKDKSFNATMKTNFDNSIGNINIIPQDIGRVVLNLLTNAFYVVDEKKRSGIENFEPTVSISTKNVNDKVEIKVTDNGNGIPQKVLDKIFQPFFTTKPTGKGTGLGLSMSYDIVTKGHGGDLSVETVENEGSTFTISLPI